MDTQVRELLAKGRVDEALATMRAQLKLYPGMEARGERAANTWAERAWRFVELGTLLSRPALVEEGLAEVAKVPVKARLATHRCGELERDVSTVLIDQGQVQPGLARARSRAEWISRNPGNPGHGPPETQEALLGVAGALHGAGRSAEILPLLESAEGWLATDLAEIVVEQAGSVPLGVAVARGLELRGQLALARRAVTRCPREAPLASDC